jgi:MoaA/NifB/PqqE/SkfB family radical SAM enzyme
METVSFDEYAREVVRLQGRVPLSGSLEVTWRCNLRCVHCYMGAYRSEPELSLVEIRRVIDELVDAGCLRLLITGGEPLLRPDFREIYRYAVQKGLLLTLFTNGTLVDREIAAFLKDYPPVLCEVSLYGASSASYGRVCGCPEAFEKALAGVDLLRAAVPHLGVKSLALLENAEEMGLLEHLCAERGVDFSYDTDLFPRLDGNPEPFRHAFPPEEGVRRVLDSQLHREVWGKQRHDWEAAQGRVLKRADKVVVCVAGAWTFHIGPFGDLCLCMLLRDPSYSLRSGSFREGWETLIAELIERERAVRLACVACPDLKYCMPCAGRNRLETGSMECPAPVQCARARAVRKLTEEVGLLAGGQGGGH